MKRYLYFLIALCIPICVHSMWVDDYGTNDPNQNENRRPRTPQSRIFSSEGRDLIFLQNTNNAMLVPTSPTHTPIPTMPNQWGSTCGDGRYDQVHWFDCLTDTVDLRYFGYMDTTNFRFYEAPPGYGYHYFIVNFTWNDCDVYFAYGFRADRFSGTFTLGNVLWNEQPLAITWPEEEKETNEEGEPDNWIRAFDMSGREKYQGWRSNMQLPQGAYVLYIRGRAKGEKILVLNR